MTLPVTIQGADNGQGDSPRDTFTAQLKSTDAKFVKHHNHYLAGTVPWPCAISHHRGPPEWLPLPHVGRPGIIYMDILPNNPAHPAVCSGA